MPSSTPTPSVAPITSIIIQLAWSETEPGWTATAWPADHYLDDDHRVHIVARSDFSPLPAIQGATEAISRRLNIHPDNTTLIINVEGDELLHIARRSPR